LYWVIYWDQLIDFSAIFYFIVSRIPLNWQGFVIDFMLYSFDMNGDIFALALDNWFYFEKLLITKQSYDHKSQIGFRFRGLGVRCPANLMTSLFSNNKNKKRKIKVLYIWSEKWMLPLIPPLPLKKEKKLFIMLLCVCKGNITSFMADWDI
jgi:hypothetical protein